MSNRRYSLIGLAAFAAACVANPCPVFANRYPDFLDAQYREFFAHFVDNRSLTERMLNAAGLETKDYGRGFALIAGISKYPSMAGASGNLAPASEDIRKLSDYLIRVEGFDEIVVLRGEDVTEARLSYFLQRYFPQRCTVSRSTASPRICRAVASVACCAAARSTCSRRSSRAISSSRSSSNGALRAGRRAWRR